MCLIILNVVRFYFCRFFISCRRKNKRKKTKENRMKIGKAERKKI